MAFPNPNCDLILACHIGDAASAIDAIERGALVDQTNHQGVNALQACFRGPRPDMAFELQLACERTSGRKPWRGRDGQNAASIAALSGNGQWMLLAIKALPHAIFDPDGDGQTPFGLFCERCCASASFDEHVQKAVESAIEISSACDIEKAIAACELGCQIAVDLSRQPIRDNPIASLLQAQSIRNHLAANINQESAGTGDERQGSKRL